MTTYLKFDTQADCVAAFAPYLVTDQTGDSHMPFYIGMSAVDVVTRYGAKAATQSAWVSNFR
jgi:hypothetical protein